MAELKEDELNKKTALLKQCFRYDYRINFFNFEIINFNNFVKRKFLKSLFINNLRHMMNNKDWNVFPTMYHKNKYFHPMKQTKRRV